MSQSTIKPTKWHVHPAKTQISLSICPVWQEFLMCALWVAKDQSLLQADSKDWSDWVDIQADLGTQINLLVLLCSGSNADLKWRRKDDYMMTQFYAYHVCLDEGLGAIHWHGLLMKWTQNHNDDGDNDNDKTKVIFICEIVWKTYPVHHIKIITQRLLC